MEDSSFGKKGGKKGKKGKKGRGDTSSDEEAPAPPPIDDGEEPTMSKVRVRL